MSRCARRIFLPTGKRGIRGIPQAPVLARERFLAREHADGDEPFIEREVVSRKIKVPIQREGAREVRKLADALKVICQTQGFPESTNLPLTFNSKRHIKRLTDSSVKPPNDREFLPFRLKTNKYFIKKRLQHKQIVCFHPPENLSRDGWFYNKRELPRFIARFDGNDVFSNFLDVYIQL